MIPFHLQTIAEMSASRIFDCLIEGTLIALCAALALRLRRQHNSGTRFAIWFSALMAIAALPLLAGAWSSIPALRAAVLPPSIHHSAITLPASFALYLFAAWAVIATLSLSRVVISLRHIHVLRKSCTAIDPAQLDSRIRETLNHAPSIALCTSDQVQVPTAVGFFKPAVVMPVWLLDELAPQELNQILLHELAHLRRRDDWTNLAQQIVKALFFFHPAVWWIEKKISLEREMACDDAVLAATAQPRAYAECLAHLAERTFIRRTLSLAQAALGRMRHTTLRVAEILNPNRERIAQPTWKPALSLIAAFAVGSVVLASREPQLIAFQDSSSQPMQQVNNKDRVAAEAFLRPVERSSTGFISTAPDAPMLKPIPAAYTIPSTPSRSNRICSAHSHQKKTRNLAAPAPNFVRAQINTPQPNPAKFQLAPNPNSEIVSFFFANQFASQFATEFETQFETHTLAPSLVHPASFATDSAATTQTIFIITQDPDVAAGQPVYQIHFWRVTVFHPVAASKPIPNKET
jgi:beta-lactamase regulating signal transducer with metallopeptidase domain